MSARSHLLIGTSAAAIHVSGAGGGVGDPYWAQVSFISEFRSPECKANPSETRYVSGTLQFARDRVRSGKASCRTGYGLNDNEAIMIPKAVRTLGTADFTYECWFASPTVPTASKFFFSQWDTNTNNGTIRFGYSNTLNKLYVNVLSSSTMVTEFDLNGGAINSAYLFDGKFHHLAVTREGPFLRLFVDGVMANKVATIGTSALTPTTGMDGMNLIGGCGIVGAPDNGIDGWFDSVRLTIGVCRYNASFDLPVGAFPIGGADPHWASVAAIYDFEEPAERFGFWHDGNAVITAINIVRYGDRPLRPDGFYGDSSPQYTTYTLSGTAMDLGSGDFTMEFFGVSCGASSTGKQVVGHNYPAAGEYGWWLGNTSTGGNTVRFSYSPDGTAIETILISGTTVTNADIAVVRSGSDLYVYLNGTRISSTSIITPIYYPASTPLAINRAISSGGATAWSTGTTGKIAGVRITKGVARYSGATYVPPILPVIPSFSGDPADPGAPVERAPFLYTQHALAVVGDAVLGDDLRATQQTIYAVVGDGVLGDDLRVTQQTIYAIVES